MKPWLLVVSVIVTVVVAVALRAIRSSVAWVTAAVRMTSPSRQCTVALALP